MKPVLFAEGDNDYSTNGIGVLHDALKCEVFEEYNGIFDLELEYPADGEWVKELVRKAKILAKPNDVDDPHAFRIYEIGKDIDSGVIYVRASSIADDLSGNLLKHVKVEDATPQQALNAIKADLIEPTIFDFVSDIQTRSWSEWTRINPLQAIVGTSGSIVDLWGGDIKRTNNTIYLYSRRGRDKVTTVMPGKNIDGFNMTVSDKGVVTKILPFYTYEPVDIPVYKMEPDGEGNVVKVQEYEDESYVQPEPETITGDVVISANAGEYLIQKYTPIDYSQNEYINERVDSFISEREEQAEASPIPIDNSGFKEELKQFVTSLLNEEASAYFVYTNPGVDEPNIDIKTNLIQLSDSPEWKKYKNLERVQVSDTVDVYVKKFDADIEVTIQSIRYDSIGERTIEITAGSARNNLVQSITRPYEAKINELQKYISTMENGVYNTIGRTANGQSRRFKGYSEPPASISTEGDLWFKDIGNGRVETYMFKSGVWEALVTSDKIESIERTISEAVTKAENADEKAQDTIDSINETLVGTGKISLADLIASKVSDGDFETLFFQESKAIGLVYNNNGVDEAIIMIEDGVPYIKGENIILNGDTIVDGDFTVTETMLAENAVIDSLMATGIDAQDVRIINLDASSITGGDLEVTETFRITHNGIPVFEVDAATGKVKITAPDLATKEDLSNIELTPGPPGPPGSEGEKGEQGIPGPPGEDGTSSYIHFAYATGTDGQNFSVSHFSLATYIGMYADGNLNDSTDYTKYKWSLIKGADGTQGIPGTKGADGLTPYFHTAWANNDTGTSGFSTTVSLNKTHMGVYSDHTSADSADPAKYSWTLIKGPQGVQGEPGLRGLPGLEGGKGEQGVPGPPGIDGKSSYTHFAYATGTAGQGFSTSSFVNATYIGMYVDDIATDSNDYTKYNWTLIKGADGNQGIPGTKGADGLTPYFHTAWANNATGTSGFSTTVSANKLYIGTYSDHTSTDSADPAKYSWVLIKGEKGDTGTTGLQGPPGADGTSQYVHIRYSANASGASMTTTPQSNTAYIGIVNTTSSTAPGYTSFSWSLIKGPQGNQGIQGPPGSDGQPTYTWIKYADSDTGAGLSDTPDGGKRYIGMAFNKTTSTESSSASDYVWSPLYDNVKVGVRNLLLNSKTWNDFWHQAFGVTYESEVAMFTNVTGYNKGRATPAKPNTTYTVSVDVMSSIDKKTQFLLLDFVDASNLRIDYSFLPSMDLTTQWQRHSYTFTTPDLDNLSGICFSPRHNLGEGNTLYMRYPKIEEGNIATPWTEAPEDIQAILDEKAATRDLESLGQIVSSVSSLINFKAGMGEFEALEAAFDARVAQEILDRDKLIADLSTIKGRTKIIEEVAGANRIVTEFIDTVISSSEEGVFISKGSSSTGILIGVDRISFMDNNIEVAYISNQTMQISHGIFVESAVISDFKFEKIPNTSILAITWVGD